MSELKACPFCGCQTDAPYKDSDGFWTVECFSVECPVQPQTCGSTLAVAIERWNRRAEPSAQGQAVELRERLAAYSHATWCCWMEYLFAQCIDNDDGTTIIPAHWVSRWSRQAKTAYIDLPENEKDTDREEADAILELIAPPSPVQPAEGVE